MTVARFAVRHRVPAARWPTAAEAARSRWFSPARIGRLDVAARTWVPAMVPWRATEDGFVTPEVLEGYARFAEGQPGVLVVEATRIRDIPCGPPPRGAARGAPRCSRGGGGGPWFWASAGGWGTPPGRGPAGGRGCPPPSPPGPPAAPARPASTASSSTTPTPTRWPRSSRG